MTLTVERTWAHRPLYLVGLIMAYIISTAAASAPALVEYGMAGRIGNYPIALVINIKDNVHIVSAHYSYASQKKSIPLRGEASGTNVTLTEPGGATFNLHLTSTASISGKPLTFYTATGLNGTWTETAKQLPVTLTLRTAGSSHIEDCTLYPNPTPPSGAHFPNPGCKHTPDKPLLDACIARPFTTNAAAFACIDKAMAPCATNQYDSNYCVGNVDAYLDQIVHQRLGHADANKRMTQALYMQWDTDQTKICTQTTEFSPEGTGYGADVTFCMAADRLRLLQNELEVSSMPIRRLPSH